MRRVSQAEAQTAEAASPGGGMHAVRETIESIVIAFVLAFLFRTFEAEAFVIPTGSMSPSLQGQHKDVDCTECGYRFRVSASSEGEDNIRMFAELQRRGGSLHGRQDLMNQISGNEVVAGMCPMCRQTMAFRTDLPAGVPSYVNQEDLEKHTSYPGDRILVNKYCYLYNDPLRWDVVVFKYPGNGEMNYIKRLVGLPGETVQIYQGDIFTRPEGEQQDFRIERKPADKVRVMLQPVHDTDYDSAELYQAGWPLRWSASSGWQVEANVGDQTVDQKFTVESADVADGVAWLRYQHLPPSENDWAIVRAFAKTGEHQGQSKAELLKDARPQLIRDFNSYNASRLRREIFRSGWEMPPRNLGMHWVSDLAVECDVEVEKAAGELVLDLVESGKHFRCTIDLKTGEAKLGIDGLDSYGPVGATTVKSAGDYRLVFANVDDQLLLWVDDELVDFGDSTYEVEELFSKRDEMIPRTSEEDAGDLSPVGVGARGTSLVITRLQVFRDIYYGAIDWHDANKASDYKPVHIATELADGTRVPSLRSVKQLFVEPGSWARFSTRQRRDFEVEEGQLFVLGDNSPASSDCRLWTAGNGRDGSRPGGPYFDRRLLIGKAVFVFWPHSWGGIPGLQKLPGFPNFGDMRIVR
ncbi:MAG: signal peptidase I [Planctomycetes bacterium]|nr:signal peptidase I [Planctomycetota bacterium]